MTRTLRLLAVVALGGAALAGCSTGTGTAAAAGGSAKPPVITARGVGTVTGTPDVATVVLGVQTQAPGAKGALDANSQKMTALLDTLKSKGVAAADLQTSQLSINPTFAPNGRITGYDVANQVTATVRDITAAGGLIDAAGAAAGDAVRVQQLGFSIGDDSAPRAQARAGAVRQAQAQARQLAEAAGVRLGPLNSITEAPARTVTPFAADADAAASSAAVPVQPGRQELSVTVEVSYAIDQ